MNLVYNGHVTRSKCLTVTPMALSEILITFIGPFLLPIIIVVGLAIFLHCVLLYRQNREQRASRFDSSLFTSQNLRSRQTLEEQPLISQP